VTARFFPQHAPPDDEPLPLPRTVWIVAALGALAIHAAGGALAFHYLQRDAADDDLGAPAMVIDVDLASPRGIPTDLPVGPDTEASAPAPAVVEQKQVVEQTDLPKAVPTETDDPERVVSPTDSTKPKDEDPKMLTIQALPSEQSVATEATAVPTVESAVPSSRSTAPSLGTGDNALRERVTWQKELAAHFNKYKRYPADRASQAAEVVVNFVLDRMGHIVSSSVMKGSGDAAFDDAALAMLQRSDPVPPPPPLVAEAGLTFTMPVIFHVNGQK
jgi:periplasmic protein TonB